MRHRLGSYAGKEDMTIATTLEKYLVGRPKTKREEDVIALKLFCLFSFILVGLILSGIL